MKPKIILLVAAGLALVAIVILTRHDPGVLPVAVPPAATGQPAEMTPVEVPKATPTPQRLASIPPAAPPHSPFPVATIAGTSGENLKMRWQAVQSLSRNLSREEIQSLYGYLNGHESETNAHMRGVLKNDVILALKAQIPPPADLVTVLLGIFNDQDQDAVIRDYALQHLISSYGESTDRTAIQEALWKAGMETNSNLAGTALLGLHRLSQIDPQIDSIRLSQMAQAMTGDPRVPEPVQITSIQVCAERQLVSALPSISAVLGSPDSGVPLKMSAIAALGALGDASQLPVLEKIRSSGNPALQTAVEAALKRLKRRVQA